MTTVITYQVAIPIGVKGRRSNIRYDDWAVTSLLPLGGGQLTGVLKKDGSRLIYEFPFDDTEVFREVHSSFRYGYPYEEVELNNIDVQIGDNIFHPILYIDDHISLHNGSCCTIGIFPVEGMYEEYVNNGNTTAHVTIRTTTSVIFQLPDRHSLKERVEIDRENSDWSGISKYGWGADYSKTYSISLTQPYQEIKDGQISLTSRMELYKMSSDPITITSVTPIVSNSYDFSRLTNNIRTSVTFSQNL